MPVCWRQQRLYFFYLSLISKFKCGKTETICLSANQDNQTIKPMASLFISCVSNEFANYRDAIRRHFTRPNLDTKIQEDFIDNGGATLEKLDEYIQHCDAVVHICGNMTGSMANEISLQYINDKYKDFGNRFPVLQPVLSGTCSIKLYTMGGLAGSLSLINGFS